MNSIFKLKVMKPVTVQTPVTDGPAGSETHSASGSESKSIPGSLSAGEHMSNRLRKKDKKQQRAGEPNAQADMNPHSKRSAFIIEDDFRE